VDVFPRLDERSRLSVPALEGSVAESSEYKIGVWREAGFSGVRHADLKVSEDGLQSSLEGLHDECEALVGREEDVFSRGIELAPSEERIEATLTLVRAHVTKRRLQVELAERPALQLLQVVQANVRRSRHSQHHAIWVKGNQGRLLRLTLQVHHGNAIAL